MYRPGKTLGLNDFYPPASQTTTEEPNGFDLGTRFTIEKERTVSKCCHLARTMPILPQMQFVRQYRPLLLFAAFLVFCSVMVIRQFDVNQSKHVELREAFILLNSRGYEVEANRLYERLLAELEDLSDKALLDDFQRTLTLVDPAKGDPENLVWKYHWTVSNELEKRSTSSLQRALKLARER